jgi:hypothetical protein
MIDGEMIFEATGFEDAYFDDYPGVDRYVFYFNAEDSRLRLTLTEQQFKLMAETVVRMTQEPERKPAPIPTGRKGWTIISPTEPNRQD